MSQAIAVADVKALTGQITMLAEYFNYELEPHVLRVYVDGLRDVPHDAMRAGCRHLIQTARFMPKVAEIRAAVDATQPVTDVRAFLAGREYVCTRCEDNGWVVTAERTDARQPIVTRCACYTTNRRLVQAKRFSEAER